MSYRIFIHIVFSALIALTIFCINIENVKGQHHGAPPPLATIGDRQIAMNFLNEPNPIKSGQTSFLKFSLHDENSGEKVQHVTYRVSISKDDQVMVSDFFHSHVGDLSISIKGNTASNIGIGGTFDVLTNAYIPDPSGSLQITGPIFSQTGKYIVDIEVITMDNDKTDLPNPLKYQFNVNVG